MQFSCKCRSGSLFSINDYYFINWCNHELNDRELNFNLISIKVKVCKEHNYENVSFSQMYHMFREANSSHIRLS
jgi:hypothetical protein